VLADASIVVLALPEIYRDFNVSVNAVIWVLVAFNLVLAAAAVPAALVARRVGPARVTAAGLALFALGGLFCGLSTSLPPLIAARCLQAVGGAGAVTGALELMPSAVGSERLAARAWATAGGIGAALGPAAGGLLTELCCPSPGANPSMRPAARSFGTPGGHTSRQTSPWRSSPVPWRQPCS
jgi:MFS family permease